MKTLLTTTAAVLALAFVGLAPLPAAAQSVSVSVHGERGSVYYRHRDHRHSSRYYHAPRAHVEYRAPRRVYDRRYEQVYIAPPAYVNPYLEPKCVARNIDGNLYWYYC